MPDETSTNVTLAHETYVKHMTQWRLGVEDLKSLLTIIARDLGIQQIEISGRVKSQQSYIEKFERKNYEKTGELTDMMGLRMITQFQEDVHILAVALEHEFEANVEDKSTDLGSDRFGYLSTHLECRLGANRRDLTEWKHVAPFPFEIQVRTQLQHAWAEFEHERGYKNGEIPREVRRELSLLAGLLETADNAFSRIRKEVESLGDLPDEEPLTSFYAVAVAREIAPGFTHPKLPDPRFMLELTNFGITTIADAKSLLSDLVEGAHQPDTTVHGGYRDAMMVRDTKRYFDDAWNNNWHGLSVEGLATIKSRLNSDSIFRLIDEEVMHLYHDPKSRNPDSYVVAK